MAAFSKDTKKILREISDITGEKVKDFGWLMNELIEIFCDPYGRLRRGLAPKNIYWSVSSLRRGNYLKELKVGGRKMVGISNKGRAVLLRETIRTKSLEGQWDKKWRIVIFDIPESDRRERNFLRSYLKEFGLKELQKSVWIFPYDIEQEFKEFLSLCDKRLEGDTRFVTIEKMSYDADIKRYFKSILRGRVKKR